MFCPKAVINNFTDFVLLYDKFAALRYNEDKLAILQQCSEKFFLVLHNFEQTRTDRNNL